jgi:hypothetical protein
MLHPVEWMKNHDMPLAIVPLHEAYRIGDTLNGWVVTRVVRSADDAYTVYGRKP